MSVDDNYDDNPAPDPLLSSHSYLSFNSFAAAGNYSRQRALSAGVDRSRHILHASEIYHILHSNGLWETTHCGVLSKN